MKKERNYKIVALVIITPVGFYTKFYHGPFEDMAHQYLGGFFYVIFWALLWSLTLPRARALTVSVAVFIATCAVEFLQLWHPPFLEYLRSFFIGRTILGTSFTWYDFPWYAAGSIAACFLLTGIKKAAVSRLNKQSE